tara:strand:+ start:2119 stop:2298 length:180 start_codon:yes stop_codon:yes gene_type:complete
MKLFIKDYLKNWKLYFRISLIDIGDQFVNIFGRDGEMEYNQRYIRQEKKIDDLYKKYHK